VNSEVTTITPDRPAAASRSAHCCGPVSSGMAETTTSSSQLVTPRMISTAHSLSRARMTRSTAREVPRRRPGGV
jgi:hypothetical protein